MDPNQNKNKNKPQQATVVSVSPLSEETDQHEQLDDAPSDGPTHETHEPSHTPGAMFQSEQAREAARAAAHVEDAVQQPKLARITESDVPRQVAVVSQAAANKLVKIRPRVSMARFRVGREWYQIQANKDCLVPKHVATLLEQKGAL